MHAKALVDAEEDGEEEGALARLEALDLVLSRAFAAEGFRRVEALCAPAPPSGCAELLFEAGLLLEAVHAQAAVCPAAAPARRPSRAAPVARLALTDDRAVAAAAARAARLARPARARAGLCGVGAGAAREWSVSFRERRLGIELAPRAPAAVAALAPRSEAARCTALAVLVGGPGPPPLVVAVDGRAVRGAEPEEVRALLRAAARPVRLTFEAADHPRDDPLRVPRAPRSAVTARSPRPPSARRAPRRAQLTARAAAGGVPGGDRRGAQGADPCRRSAPHARPRRGRRGRVNSHAALGVIRCGAAPCAPARPARARRPQTDTRRPPCTVKAFTFWRRAAPQRRPHPLDRSPPTSCRGLRRCPYLGLPCPAPSCPSPLEPPPCPSLPQAPRLRPRLDAAERS